MSTCLQANDDDASLNPGALVDHRPKVVNPDMVVYCFDVLQAFLRGTDAPKPPKSFPNEQLYERTNAKERRIRNTRRLTVYSGRAASDWWRGARESDRLAFFVCGGGGGRIS